MMDSDGLVSPCGYWIHWNVILFFFPNPIPSKIYHYWWQLLVKQYLAVTHMKPCKTGAGTIDCFCVCCWVKGRDTWRQWGPGWLCLVTEKSLVISTFVFVFIQSFPFLASDLLIQVRWWKSEGVIFYFFLMCLPCLSSAQDNCTVITLSIPPPRYMYWHMNTF